MSADCPDQKISQSYPFRIRNQDCRGNKRFLLSAGAPKTRRRFLRSAFFTGFSDGSMTVEASFVLPLILIFVSALLSFFPMMEAELKLQEAMSSTLRTLSLSDAETFEASAAALTEAGLRAGGDLPSVFSGLSFDEISCGGPEGAGGEYRIRVSWHPEVPFFDGISSRFVLTKSVSVRAWSGEGFEEAPDSRTVYVTETGSVYHTELSCTYLTLSVREVDFGELPVLRNRDGAIYYPCEYCGGEAHGAAVYITGYGTRWHSRRDCAGLRRGIRRVALYEVGDLPLCSRCRERSGE